MRVEVAEYDHPSQAGGGEQGRGPEAQEGRGAAILSRRGEDCNHAEEGSEEGQDAPGLADGVEAAGQGGQEVSLQRVAGEELRYGDPVPGPGLFGGGGALFDAGDGLEVGREGDRVLPPGVETQFQEADGVAADGVGGEFAGFDFGAIYIAVVESDEAEDETALVPQLKVAVWGSEVGQAMAGGLGLG